VIMMISFVTLNSISAPLVEGLCAHIHVGLIQVLCITLTSFAFESRGLLKTDSGYPIDAEVT